jgi:isocitrate/isopropylmalate dehydrogenase
MQHIPITVAYGNGIGPEIMEATVQMLNEAGYSAGIMLDNGSHSGASRSLLRRRASPCRAATSKAST